jgi:hypothetical protein
MTENLPRSEAEWTRRRHSGFPATGRSARRRRRVSRGDAGRPPEGPGRPGSEVNPSETALLADTLASAAFVRRVVASRSPDGTAVEYGTGIDGAPARRGLHKCRRMTEIH